MGERQFRNDENSYCICKSQKFFRTFLQRVKQEEESFEGQVSASCTPEGRKLVAVKWADKKRDWRWKIDFQTVLIPHKSGRTFSLVVRKNTSPSLGREPARVLWNLPTTMQYRWNVCGSLTVQPFFSHFLQFETINSRSYPRIAQSMPDCVYTVRKSKV